MAAQQVKHQEKGKTAVEGKQKEAGSTISWTKAVAVIGTIVAIAATLHAGAFVPALKHDVGLETDKKIKLHEARPHSHAVSRDELKLVIDQMSNFATRDQIDALNKRLDDLINRIDSKK